MPTVSVRQGTIRGLSVAADGSADDSGQIAAFLGIPYAAAPVGERLFLPPQPAEWSGELDATKRRATPPQIQYPEAALSIVENPLVEGEDFLNLNVWVSKEVLEQGEAAKAPVYVFIHGGAYRNGSGSISQLEGTGFAEKGIVAVTINYRLGVLGGLQLEDGTSNNQLRDQIAALEWVRDNIAAFGGDPEHVVVGGESAGAMSIGALLTSPKAKGLFHGAILQSGAAHNSVSQEAARAVGRRYAEYVGLEPNAKSLGSLEPKKAFEAGAAVEQEISTSADKDTYFDLASNSMTWQPSVDGDVLPEHPIEALKAGRGADVPVLIGTNLDEGTFFVVGTGIFDKVSDDDVKKAAAAWGAKDPEKVFELNVDSEDPRPGTTMVNLFHHWKFLQPLGQFIDARVENSDAPTFRYRFDWKSPKFGGALGSHHMLEIPFTFHTIDRQAIKDTVDPEAPVQLADDVHGAWVSFIKDLNPGWDPHTADSRPTGVFSAEGRRVDTDVDRQSFIDWAGHR